MLPGIVLQGLTPCLCQRDLWGRGVARSKQIKFIFGGDCMTESEKTARISILTALLDVLINAKKENESSKVLDEVLKLVKTN